MLKDFDKSGFLFTYYRYLDKFHTEPKQWGDLFEFLEYNKIDAKLNAVVQSTQGASK